ncbi:unannotated protein [freshwater metagenome]|uniref:Unannotated protein n=1 Tax=freshwater metagenome TaxID=449393 RepID=A0A6J6H1M2_9ZZZZ|nr:hypothetical protein [Actinomycetota bacterium]
MMRRALSVVGVIALLFVLCPRGASAQTTKPAPHQLSLVHQTAFVGPNGTFAAELSTGDLPATTKLNLVLYNAITTRSRLDRTIAGEQLGSALFSTTATVLSATTSTTTLSLPINEKWPAPEGGTVLSESGIYPVLIEATAPNGSRIDSIVTHLLRLPSATTPTTPISLATTVVIDSPFDVSSEGSPQLSDAQLARASEQFRILSSSAATPLTLAATPFVVQALTDAGDSSARPTSQARQTLSRPYVAIDAGSLMAGGRGSLIEKECDAGDNVLAATFEAAPDRRTQVLDPSVSPAALDRLAARGTRSVVLQSSQLRSAIINDETSVLTNRFVIEGENGTSFAAMANDDTASSRFVMTTDPVLGAHHVLAEIMMLHQEQPGASRGAAVTIPSATETAALQEFLAGLSATTGAASGSVGNSVIQPVTLDELFARTGVATASQKPIVRAWTSNEPTELGVYGNRLEQAQWDLLGLQSMLPEGGDIIAPIERTVLASAETTLESSDRLALLDNADSQLQSLTSALSLPSSQKVTLTSSSGKIPLVITNALPVAALVRITVSSPKLEFPEGTTYELVLSPSSTTRTDIAVTTRASGAFPLDVEVASSGGGLLVATSRIDVRSTAISGFGLFVSVVAGLFLLVWWGRHFRHTRRARALVANDEPSPTSGG